MEIIDRLERYWSTPGRGEANRSGKNVTEEEIKAFEARKQVRLPADLRAFFLCLNGTDGNGDYQLFRFLAFDEFEAVESWKPRLIDAESYFDFADFMIDCYRYAIYLGNEPTWQNRVILTGYPGNPVVAQSFTEFLELYLRDDIRLHGHSLVSP
jgi:hypothetical protein